MSRPVPLGGDTANTDGSHRLRDRPWGVRKSNHILGDLAVGPKPGRWVPLANLKKWD